MSNVKENQSAVQAHAADRTIDPHRSLAQARKAQISFDWCGVYKVVTGVIIGFPGERNMRSQAVEIVMDYIAPHQDYCRGT